MSVALQRYPIFDVASPLQDLVFYEVVDYNIKLNRDAAYGTPHHDPCKYPHHVLVFITPADKEGKTYRFYYAAKRENQDEYNWEFVKADIGGNKFDAVSRTYIVLRTEFSESTPAMGSAMPDVPADKFNGDYILSSRIQQRDNGSELDSTFVIEKRTYIKRCQLTDVVGSKLSIEERLYYKDELIEGTSVEDLFSDPSDNFWQIQSDGSSRVGKQLSCDWYSITTQRELKIYFIWPTPEQQDFIFYVFRNTSDNPSSVTNYGATFGGDYPDHKLVYISPTDEKGRSKFYYASDRINQDDYNWEFTSADIGGTKFSAVTRTYLTPRADFDPDLPAMGSAMINTPTNLFSGDYILSAKTQKRTGEQEFDSLYVIEQRTYVKRCSITEILGSKLSVEENLYYKGEEIGNTPVEELFSNSSAIFWELQPDGSSNVGKQLSCEWYLITTQRELEIYFIWPTPEQQDYLFYVVRNSTGNPSATAVYGSSFSSPYSSHKLVYVSPTDERGRSKFYYAADRINEDDYNWQINDGKELIRTYVKLRSTYSPTPKTEVTDPDAKFTEYVFADESVVFGDEILNGLFVVVKKRYLPKEIIEFAWNKDFEKYIKITKKVKEANEEAPPVSTPGKVVEIQNVNTFYSIEITQELPDQEFPYEKKPVIDSIDINFPNKLESISLLRASAFADSAGATPAYDEDSNYKYEIVVPRAGPYKATIRRFITDDPETLVEEYELVKIPVAQIDMLTEVWAWWYASPEQNIARAKASALQLPATIHDTISVVRNPPPNGPSSVQGVDTLPETPGYSDFVNKQNAILQHKIREMDMNLFEVSIVEVDIQGLYS